MNFHALCRLATDVKVTSTNSGKTIAKFAVAIPRPYSSKRAEGAQDADFMNAVAFSGTADFISRHFKKGARILLEGSIRTDRYEKEGQTRYSMPYVLISEVSIIDFNKSNGDTTPAPNQSVASSAPADDWGNSDIPF